MRLFYLFLIIIFTSCQNNTNTKTSDSISTQSASSPEPATEAAPSYTPEQIDSINNTKLQSLLNRKLIYHAWKTTNHSNPGDIQDRGSAIVDRVNPTSEESDIVLELRKNHTYTMIFKPVYCQEQVTKTGKWKWNDNGQIELDKNVFATTMVQCMDYPGSDPLEEYVFVSKTIDIENGYVVLDVRETDRCSFFAHMALVNQDDENKVDEADYAYSALDKLSLSTDLVTQYLQYLQ